jgi:hypothetical protein
MSGEGIGGCMAYVDVEDEEFDASTPPLGFSPTRIQASRS